ncbi:MAG: hypothetical protein KTR30_14075 [Saprospiraceae bacterium]|nr:hypothetical protein [Saprospiraceae bacterium]
MSARFRIFAVAVGVLFLVNLLFWNGVASLWSGGEAALWWNSHLDTKGAGVPGWWLTNLSLNPADLAEARWISGGLLLIGLIFFNWIGQKIFKQQRVILSLLVMASSLMLPNFGKLASADIYLFLAHFGAYLSVVLYMKQPIRSWQALAYIFLFLGLIIHPVSTLLFWSALAAWLWWRHPNGKNLSQLYLWIVAPAVSIVLILLGQFHWQPIGFSFSVNQFPIGKFLLYSVIGMAPFTGYLFGGLRDNVMMVRKGEEQAVIYTGGLIAGLLAFSLSWQAFLALLVAKQMEVYFKDNYPFRDWVKTGAILHLVLLFAFAFALLYNGFIYFEGDGYRAGMAVAGSYWALSFVAVIGLYGVRRPLALGASLLSGLVGMTFFWLQLYPLMEEQRSLVRQVPLEVQKLKPEATAFVFLPRKKRVFPNTAVYAHEIFPTVSIEKDESSFNAALVKPEAVGVTTEWTLPYIPEGKTIDTLNTLRWSDLMTPSAWLLITDDPTEEE